MSKIRQYYTLLLALVAALFLAACDGQGGVNQSATTAPAASSAAQPATTSANSAGNSPAAAGVVSQPTASDAGIAAPTASPAYQSKLEHRGPMPAITSDTWLNSSPLTSADLRGHVVIVEFWTFLCYNCNNALPGLKAVYNQYKDAGLIVIGVHSPELAPERDVENVRKAVAEKGITWPVPIDPDFKIWGAFKNAYWPAFYIVDKHGEIRSVRVGEGNDEALMSDVADLLREP